MGEEEKEKTVRLNSPIPRPNLKKPRDVRNALDGELKTED